MNNALVSEDDARRHLRVDPDEDVAIYLGAAAQAAQDFLGRQVYADADALAAGVQAGSAGVDPMIINDAIRAAILLQVGHLYRNREDVVTGSGSAAVAALPLGSRSLLWPYRVGLGV